MNIPILGYWLSRHTSSGFLLWSTSNSTERFFDTVTLHLWRTGSQPGAQGPYCKRGRFLLNWKKDDHFAPNKCGVTMYAKPPKNLVNLIYLGKMRGWHLVSSYSWFGLSSSAKQTLLSQSTETRSAQQAQVSFSRLSYLGQFLSMPLPLQHRNRSAGLFQIGGVSPSGRSLQRPYKLFRQVCPKFHM